MMNRLANPTVVRAVGIVMVVVALLNLASALTFLGSVGLPEIEEDDAEIEGAPPAEMVQTVGTIGSPVGNLTLLVTPFLLVIGVALALRKRWEMPGVIALVVEMFAKVGVIIAMLMSGRTVGVLLPVVLLVVEAVAAFLLWREWNARRRQDTGEPQPVEHPIYR